MLTATNNSPNLMSLLYPSSEPQTPNRGVLTPNRLPIGTPHGTPSSRPIGTPSHRPTITTTPNTSAIPAATPPVIGGGAIKSTPTGGGTDETTRTKPASSGTSIKQRTSLIDAFEAASNVPQDGGGGGGGVRPPSFVFTPVPGGPGGGALPGSERAVPPTRPPTPTLTVEPPLVRAALGTALTEELGCLDSGASASGAAAAAAGAEMGMMFGGCEESTTVSSAFRFVQQGCTNPGGTCTDPGCLSSTTMLPPPPADVLGAAMLLPASRPDLRARLLESLHHEPQHDQGITVPYPAAARLASLQAFIPDLQRAHPTTAPVIGIAVGEHSLQQTEPIDPTGLLLSPVLVSEPIGAPPTVPSTTANPGAPLPPWDASWRAPPPPLEDDDTEQSDYPHTHEALIKAAIERYASEASSSSSRDSPSPPPVSSCALDELLDEYKHTPDTDGMWRPGLPTTSGSFLHLSRGGDKKVKAAVYDGAVTTPAIKPMAPPSVYTAPPRPPRPAANEMVPSITPNPVPQVFVPTPRVFTRVTTPPPIPPGPPPPGALLHAHPSLVTVREVPFPPGIPLVPAQAYRATTPSPVSMRPPPPPPGLMRPPQILTGPPPGLARIDLAHIVRSGVLMRPVAVPARPQPPPPPHSRPMSTQDWLSAGGGGGFAGEHWHRRPAV